MSTTALLALDLGLAVLLAVVWLAAAVLVGGARRPLLPALLVAGVLLVAARIAVVVALGARSWWFVQEDVLLTVPLVGLPAVAAVALAGPAVLRGRPVPVAGRVALLATGFGAAAGVAAWALVGVPVRAGTAAAVVAVVATATAVAGVVLGGRARGLLVGALVTVGVLVVAVPATAAAVRSGDGGHGGHGGHGAGGVSVAGLRTPADAPGPPRRAVLTARQQAVELPSGRTVDAWTFGSLPGPLLEAEVGDLVEVELRNRDVAAGVTLHWHGYDVPNGEDGVAGVTQDAVPPGGTTTYRFVADEPGTYWYHTHQESAAGVQRGLYGAFVVRPPGGDGGTELTLPVHTIDGVVLLGATDLVDHREVPPGERVRLRLLNTDSEPHRLSLAGAPFRVVAVDGRDLTGPEQVTGEVLRIPAGSRYDVALTMPGAAVRLGIEGTPATGLVLTPPGDDGGGDAPFADGPELDLLGYGTPGPPPAAADRELTVVLDRQLRFLDGLPGYAWTVNGAAYPDVAPLTVREGERVRLTVVNRGTETHPMHPHGHHVRVLARDGVPVRGSPLELDTFDVRPGEVWEVLLVADNPGIWLAHCHDLDHATNGMVLHLAYEGVHSPFTVGGGNHPE
ncbi:multicopper oxidase family protein [Geodermatophilus sp. SYSU D00691]